MGIYALLEACLTDEEWKSLGEGRAIGYCAVGAYAAIRKEGRIANVLRSSSATYLWAGVLLSMAPIECIGRSNIGWNEGRSSSWWHFLRHRC